MNQARLYSIILGPHISEKATIMAETRNQVAFKVINDATKTEVKEAVEKLFKVSVTGLQILNVKGKTKRNKYGLSKRPSWKKAHVRVEQGPHHETLFLHDQGRDQVRGRGPSSQAGSLGFGRTRCEQLQPFGLRLSGQLVERARRRGAHVCSLTG